MLFDIVTPIGPDDASQINLQLEFTKKNIIGYRNIYLISYDPNINIINKTENIIIIDESIFPFNINDIANIQGKYNRNGWYLQQLLKLYAGQVIPNILERYLVIDCDTFFLNKTNFIDNATNKCLYAYGTEYHIPYFEHMKRLHPMLEKQNLNHSGICHHMMFETKYLKNMFSIIEFNHNNNQPFWYIFLSLVDKKLTGMYSPYYVSGASEYEIYFNYMLKFFPNEIIIRNLKWKNCGTISLDDYNNYDYISCHYYMRTE